MELNTAITLLLALIDNLQRVSQSITAARADGRTQLTPTEWAGILAAADTARAALTSASVPVDPPAPEGA